MILSTKFQEQHWSKMIVSDTLQVVLHYVTITLQVVLNYVTDILQVVLHYVTDTLSFSFWRLQSILNLL